MFSCVATANSVKSLKTMLNLLHKNEQLCVSGGMLVPESRDVLGRKQVWTLTLSVRAVSFGAAIAAMRTLSSMNFEVASMLDTFYDGLIGTQ